MYWAPLTLFCLKEGTSTNGPEQLVAIDPVSGKETHIATLTDIPFYQLPGIIYLAATNEIVYYNYSGTALLKTNVTTKQSGTLRIAGSSASVRFDKFVTDKNGNLYSIRSDESDRNDYVRRRNEIAGIWEDKSLYRFNVGTSTPSVTQLTAETKYNYVSVTSN